MIKTDANKTDILGVLPEVGGGGGRTHPLVTSLLVVLFVLTN